MITKPDEKPLVLRTRNPKTKQNKTKQGGFWFSNQNQNPPHPLASQPNKRGSFSCFFFCPTLREELASTSEKRFSTGFQQCFQQQSGKE